MLYGERRFFPTPGAACHAEGAPGRCRSWPLSSSSLAGLASLGGESGGSGSLALFFLFPPGAWWLQEAHIPLCVFLWYVLKVRRRFSSAWDRCGKLSNFGVRPWEARCCLHLGSVLQSGFESHKASPSSCMWATSFCSPLS